ncbi:Hint domain-containing protein [Chondromyces apiculatus]|uniref:Hint domain-containing protein n=1 Tax=Chondromyces apiculatus DSM 436 TaxID=1192034 RepID=A0A017TCC7_9BACT|nr:Hint domain-containing protein [Chondromyces apiculatus]EYF06909.1 Hypothetical protein CAP_1167 [Chondromyces apiculatus DSM 436]
MSKLSFRNLLGLVSLSILASACTISTEDAEEMPSPEVVREDASYMKMRFETAEKRTSLKLDLADDKQFRFMENRMRRAGITAKTAPEIVDRIMVAREKAIAMKAGVSGSSLEARALDAAGAAPESCDTFVFAQEVDDQHLKTQGRAGCINGLEYVYQDSYQFDANLNVLAFDYKESTGVDEPDGVADVELDTANPPVDQGVYADSFVFATKNGVDEAYYHMSALLVNAAAEAPVPVSINMGAPYDQNVDNEIRLCLERETEDPACDYKHRPWGACSGNAICDRNDNPAFPIYPAGTYNDDKLYMPMKGSSTPAAANSLKVDKASAWLTLSSPGDTTPAGGFCKADLTGAPQIRLQAFTAVRKGLVIDAFAPALGNANWPDHCVDHRQYVDLHVEVTTVDSVTGVQGPTFGFSSQKNADHISIWWGCMPPGTDITMADGNKLDIEKIVPGQKVLADEKGRMLTVVDVVQGSERHPLVRVVDSFGNAVSMTNTHPVPTVDARIIKAEDLMIGDRIQTADGVAVVAHVEKEDYEGAVYNLVLGTPEERAAMSAEETTMYANGVLVGDSQMQTLVKLRSDEAALAKRAESVPQWVRAGLPGIEKRREARGAR